MRRAICVCVVPLLLAACAHGGATLSSSERLELYQRHAGAPVNSLQLNRTLRRLDWTPLGDQSMALWTAPSRGHLLEFRNRCSGLATAQDITITNTFGTVTARFDSVIVRTPGQISPVAPGCRISRIRPLDARALRDEKREIREAQLADRPEGVQPEPEGDMPGGGAP